MPATTDIERYVDTYEVGPDHRQLSAAERQLASDLLIDYLCHEQWNVPEPDYCQLVKDLTSLATSTIPELAASSAEAATAITDLTARLARRERANMIMREQLALASDTVRRLREVLDGVRI